jgi:hypothetical protein
VTPPGLFYFLTLHLRSGALINVGITVAKKNPVLVSSYVVGIVLCLFFSGIALTLEQRAGFEKDLSSIDYVSLDEATTQYEVAYERYRHSQGFFSCDERCQGHKRAMEEHRLSPSTQLRSLVAGER